MTLLVQRGDMTGSQLPGLVEHTPATVASTVYLYLQLSVVMNNDNLWRTKSQGYCGFHRKRCGAICANWKQLGYFNDI